MGSPSSHTLISSLTNLLVFLVLFPGYLTAQNDPPDGYNGKERDALYALKADFNHHFLNENWTGLQCYMNNPPRWFGIQCFNGRVTGISLESMGITGKVNVHAMVNLSELSSISFRNNSVSGNLMDFSSNPKLTYVDLSSNLFDGPISDSLLGLDFLVSLQLQGNNLIGPIPEFSQSSLREFNVSNNNLWGEIPQTRLLQSFNYSSYFGNPGLCGPPSPITCSIANNTVPSAPDTNGKKKKKFWNGATLVALFVVLDVIALTLVVMLFVIYYKKAKKNKRELKMKEMEVEEKKKNQTKIENGQRRAVIAKEDRGKLTFMDEAQDFELSDLLKASAEGLGKGNFGNAYKAMLDNGPSVVVKRLKDLKPLTSEEFGKQITVIAHLKHPNLLPLLAYYYSKDEKLLVYKLAQNGNLFNRIHGGRGNNRIPFKWNSRLSIAQGVARAMEFLHLNTKSQTIPHGNLKSSNVLLDENEVALVSDYGLASLIALPITAQQMTSYKSPEYQNRRKISKKSDVWSYGCLLLELLTGRISTYSAPQGINGVDLCSWVHRAVREEWTAEIFDLEITVRRNAAEGLLRLLQIAMRCCDKSPEKRPDMGEVVREVEDIKVSDSEDDDEFSFDRSFTTEDSFSTNASGNIGEER